MAMGALQGMTDREKKSGVGVREDFEKGAGRGMKGDIVNGVRTASETGITAAVGMTGTETGADDDDQSSMQPSNQAS